MQFEVSHFDDDVALVRMCVNFVIHVQQVFLSESVFMFRLLVTIKIVSLVLIKIKDRICTW